MAFPSLTKVQIVALVNTMRGAISGLAPLGSDQKVPDAYMPDRLSDTSIQATLKAGRSMFDTFSVAHSPLTVMESGEAYRARVGTVNAPSGVAVTSANSEGGVDVETGQSLVLVAADFFAGDALSDHGLSLCGISSAQTYLAVYINAVNGTINLSKVAAGSGTSLGSVSFTFAASSTYRVSAQLTAANHVIVRVDGVTKIDYALTSGEIATYAGNTRHGFYLKRTSWSVDRFSISFAQTPSTVPGPSDNRAPALAKPSATTAFTGWRAFDTFDRTDSASSVGTADSGHAYTVGTGTVGISSNKAYVPTNAEGGVLLDPGVTDGIFGADFFVGDQFGDHGLIFNAADYSNKLIVLMNAASQRLIIGKVVAGSFTSLAQFAVTYTTNQTYRVEAVVIGKQIRVFLDGVASVEYFLTDAEVTAFKSNTKAGFYLKRTTWGLNNFTVWLESRAMMKSKDREHQFVVDAPDTLNNFNMNAMSLRHMNPKGIAAIRALSSAGTEKMALGYGNAGISASLPFSDAAFWESSDFILEDGTNVDQTKAPPVMRRITTGVINAAFNFYLRDEVSPDGKIRWFDISAFASRKAIMMLDQINKRLYIPAPASAPTSSELIASQVTFSVDETGNLLTFTVKYSNGSTVKSGTVSLT